VGTGDKIVYVGTLSQRYIVSGLPKSIVFIILLKKDSPLFIAENKQEYPFTNGIFIRYIKSRIEQTEFKG
jgi:hypothetical protein